MADSNETTATKTPIDEKPRPKGEYKMMGLLFILSIALFVDSFRSEGIAQGVSNGPGSIPQLICGLLVLMVIGLSIQYFRRGYRDGSFKELVHYLFDKEVLILLVTVSIYGFIMTLVHFIAATLIFLVGTMYLLDPKKILQKVIIAVLTTGALVLIFSTLFQVVLP